MSQPNARLFLKPTNKDVLVRNPERGGHLAVEGEWVPNNVYWYRRKLDGDVVEVTPPKKSKTKSSSADNQE